MTTKKIVVTATDPIEFERLLNEKDGFATQFSTCACSGLVYYTAIIFVKEE